MSTWLDSLIKAAREGDDVAARGLVGYLAVCLERGEVPPAEVREYFTHALKQIGSGRSADAALYISGNTSFGRDYAIAREVWTLNHHTKDRLPLWPSTKKQGAYDVVGEKNNLSAIRVKQIYLDMRKQLDAEFFLDQPVDEEARRHFEVGMQLAFGQLVEALKKPGSD